MKIPAVLAAAFAQARYGRSHDAGRRAGANPLFAG